MNDALALPGLNSENETASDADSFLLTGLEVYNWGPFQGKHSCEIDPGGSAIIGPTGSGKTTLVDALMTLLAPFPKYNLASTGGHESDRDLISYIRGVSGAESVRGENDHIARPGKTTTGIAASYANGREKITIGAIFWVDGSSNAADDLKKLWFFSKDIDRPLDQLLLLHHEDGKQAITRHARLIVGLRIFTSKKEYLAQVRGFFEVSENAFSLLNRAAGLKQLNSIDQIFRELVLDDHSAYDRALEVAVEFDTLQGIYEELKTARRQRDSLLPVESLQHSLERVRIKLERRLQLKTWLPIWFAKVAVTLWKAEVSRIEDGVARTQSKYNDEENQVTSIQGRLDTLKERYLKLGGAAIQGIEETIEAKRQLVSSIRRNAGEYQRFIRQLGLPDTLDQTTFDKNLSLFPEKKAATQKEYVAFHEVTLALESKRRDHKLEAEALASEIHDVKARPNSNIPAPYQAFREALANHLGLMASQFPFVAELVEVKAEEERWHGAIEHAIGSERLRILVPVEHLSEALAWINQRNNKLHVRFQRADGSPPPARFFDDGFTRKLNFRDHPLSGYVKYMLGKRDRHCVASTEILKRTEYGLTVEGSMSDRDGRFEKQDQRPLNEGWLTGFDNSHQLRSLSKRLAEVQSAIHSSQAEVQQRNQAEEKLHQLVVVIENLQKLEFHEIDLLHVENELKELQERRDALTRPDSEVAQAKSEHDLVLAEQEQHRKRMGDLKEELGGHKSALETAQEEYQKAIDCCGEGLKGEEAALASKAFPIPESQNVKQLGEAESKALERIEAKIEATKQQLSGIEQKLVRAMGEAKREDTGALTETGTELRDVPDYLVRLKVLLEEALPEKLQRFLDYLNHSSGQGVTQLLSQVENEVSIIEERVADLNATLSRVDFRAGQYGNLPLTVRLERQLKFRLFGRFQARQNGLKPPQNDRYLRNFLP